MGELLMPCCKGAAVPKVSPNGLQHFAHASGVCSESEESQLPELPDPVGQVIDPRT